MDTLDVFMFGKLAGQVRRLVSGQMAFRYDSDWLHDARAIPISPQFPLQAEEFAGEAVSAYFDNLLPEGSARDFIARALHVSADNAFGILSRFGADTAGALVFLPPDKDPRNTARYLPVSPADIQNWIAYTHGVALNIPDDEDDDNTEQTASLSGAQDKMSIFIAPDGSIALPIGSAPSSHILKPNMPEHKAIPETAANEVLIMQLAHAVGIHVPQVNFVPELNAALVQRYDRMRSPDGTLLRLHQNDLCQILGYARGQKYEVEGGPTFKQCLLAVKTHSTQPDEDVRRMFEWLFFNLAVGNMDSHAKNVSLITTPGGETRLAPFYDLLCTAVYPYLSKRFAFKIGGENRPGWMRQRHLQQFADDLGVDADFLRAIAHGVCDNITASMPGICAALHEQVKHKEGVAIMGKIEEEVRRSVGRVRAHMIAAPEQKPPPSFPRMGM